MAEPTDYECAGCKGVADPPPSAYLCLSCFGLVMLADVGGPPPSRPGRIQDAAKRLRRWRDPSAALMREVFGDWELDSPPFTAPQTQSLADRGYERVNRG